MRPYARCAGRTKSAAIGIAWCISLLFAPATARAWRTVEDLGDFGEGPVRWGDDDVTYRIVGALPAELAEADVEGAVQRGLSLWAAPECSAVRPVLVTTPIDAPEVVIRWLDSGWTASGLAPTAVGTTDLTYEMAEDGRWYLTSAEILLNSEGFRWTVATGDTVMGEVDVESVAAHEGSHALGIAHNCEHRGADGAPACETDPSFADAVMFPDYQGVKRELSIDDVGAICHSYPSALCGGGCPAGTDCTMEGCTPCTGSHCGGTGTGVPPDGGASLPPPPGDGLLGDPCRDDAECASRICATIGYCSATCSRTYPCPGEALCNGETSDGRRACILVGGAFGESCGASTECNSGLCLQVDGEGHCTRECSTATGCPSGYDCTSVDARRVCRASSGCSVTAVPVDSTSFAGWIALMLVLLCRRKRGLLSRCGLLAACLILVACGGDAHPAEPDSGLRDAARELMDGAPNDGSASDASVIIDSGPPPCEPPGAMRSAPCGDCGLRSEICSDGRRWETASECLDEGECASGAVERMTLPMCAEQTRICDDACTWREWSLTTPPSGVCDPGETRIARGACTMDGMDYEFLEQTCSDACAWTATGMCDDGCDDICGTELDPCSSAEPCADGYRCAVSPGVGLYCAPSSCPCGPGFTCYRDPGCTFCSEECRRVGRLVGSPCTIDVDCGDPLRCLDGACTKQCGAAASRCPRGWTCDTSVNLCRPIPDA